ncbi:MAG: cytochrome o ubiquinol oxidase subunit IV [Mitsuaria chitosanitabida]|uniref:cytochrome o ubiquinol oxidase subunit IV n=1 Tax=Roseateles chitosanitabidus TaxID=65048 RepID=UPI001B25DBA7|nr:cytochrome o ubiquinol oxidase subunit IV [Roseateles chitosanitabidus]MBO9689998.1 cytochrome o ubiquinol oxidase subunit IV [Roseateles chitosanitabidus]
MSGNHNDHNHDHGHGHDDHDDVGYHATVKGYLIGFILSVVLTAIPFWLVMAKIIPSSSTTGIVLLVFAAVQIVVHMVYFLHMNSKVEGGWSMLSLIFTIAVVVIMLAGSIWVMFHLNSNMMPIHDMRNMP